MTNLSVIWIIVKKLLKRFSIVMFLKFVYQPDLAPLQEEFYEATKNRESFEHGCRCFRNDGTLMWTI